MNTQMTNKRKNSDRRTGKGRRGGGWSDYNGPERRGTRSRRSGVNRRGDKNSLKKIRESLMMSKAELARNAGVSNITIDRVENGKPCRLETQRKILLALGLKVSDKGKVFGSQI